MSRQYVIALSIVKSSTTACHDRCENLWPRLLGFSLRTVIQGIDAWCLFAQTPIFVPDSVVSYQVHALKHH